MTRPPLVPGLTLCEDVIGDAKGRISIIRAFTGWSLGFFPRVAPKFCVFAPVTAGLGDASFRLDVERDVGALEWELIHQVTGNLHFQGPLQTIYWVVRLSECEFPQEDEYLFTLWIDEVWMAQRILRVHS